MIIRMVVADDERVECMVLEHMVRTNLKGEAELVGSAQDGICLLRLVEEKKPDLAIVDINMPGLNGLEAIEILKMKHPGLKIIIHTAYSEFSYAQKAVQLGASDYLLKPNTKEEILASIRKVISVLEQENGRKTQEDGAQEARKQLHELSMDKWMMSLFLEQPDARSYGQVCEYCPEAGSGGIFTAWKIYGGGRMKEETRRELLEKVREELGSFCSAACLEYQELFYCLLLPGDRIRQGDWKTWFAQAAGYVVRQGKKAGVQYLAGVGRWKEADALTAGIYEARAALWHRSEPGIFFFQSQKEQKYALTGAAGRPELAQMVSRGRMEQAVLSMEEFLAAMPVPEQLDEDGRLLVCKINAACCILQLEEALEHLSSRALWKDFSFWKTFQSIEGQNDLSGWMQRQIWEIGQAYEEERIYENEYIRRVFALLSGDSGKDWPVEEAAERVGISSFYLSRLLKNSLGTTFVELLTDLRMRKAVLQLAGSQKGIREIALEAGYANQSYFYKVFKKTTGIALGDVRRYLC